MSGADTAAAKDQPDVDQILDGPLPVLPQQQEAVPPLPRDAAWFDALAKGVTAILSLRTVSAEKLAQSRISADDIETAAALLRQIAEAMRKKKAA